MRTRPRHPRRPLATKAAAACTTAALLLAACTDDPNDADDPAATDTGDAADDPGGQDEADAPAPVSDVALPDGPVGDQLTWVLARLGDGEVDPDDYADRFAEVFRDQVSATQLGAGFAQLASQGPWTLGRVAQPGGERSAQGRLTSSTAGALIVALHVDEDGRIDGLQLTPGAPEVAIDDLDDGVTRLGELADATSVLIVHLADDGTTTPLADLAPDTPRAVASAAKLYVIDAVAQAVADGELAWDDEVEVTDADRSAPSGRFQEEPAGTAASVVELATAAMALSDNTATDLLLTSVGRDRVEAAVVASGHHDPELLTPFLRTRELFAIGWGDADRQQRWADAWQSGDLDTRTTLVDDLGPGLDGVDATDVVTPAWEDGADWWASPRDLAHVWQRLWDRDDPVLAEVLAADPTAAGTGLGAELDTDVWVRVGAKPGGLPGVASATYALERADGERFVVALAHNGGPTLDVLTSIGLQDALLAELAETAPPA